MRNDDKTPVSKARRLARALLPAFPRIPTPEQDRAAAGWRSAVPALIGALTLALLLIVSLTHYAWIHDNYLIIHTLAELFAVLVAWGIFVVAWNSRLVLDNNYVLFAGVAYLFVGIIDLVHTLAYKDMGVFASTAGQTNPSTQLWIASRYVESISLLVAPLMFGRKPRARLWLGVYGAVTALLLASVFPWKVFPTCFVEGAGLTRFKVFSEYLICAILLASVVLLMRRRDRFDPGVLRLIVWSILITVLEELAFTLYGDPYGFFNLLGHYFKIVSFYLIYRAVIHIGLVAPQTVLFRDLQQSRGALQVARDKLELRVQERTAQLAAAVEELQGEARDRMHAEERVRAERQRLFSLLNMLPGYVALVDGGHRVRYANHRYLDLFGEPAGHRPCYAVQRQRRQPCQPCPARKVLQSGRAYDWEWTTRRGRTFHVWGYPFSDVDGTVVVLQLGIDVTEQKMLERQVLQIGEAERQRIGRDLHDTVGQNLTGAAFLCSALAEKLQDRHPGEAADAAKIEGLLKEAIGQTRSISHGLALIRTDEHGLATAIQELAARTAEIFKIGCSAECDDGARVGDPAVATHLYRIADEAVNNALKHSQARHIWIRLSSDAGSVRLSVRDDGVGVPDGFDDEKGIGLRTMQHRSDMIGATFRVAAAPGGGTIVECALHPERPRG